jgi:hypothetical protein
MHHGSFSRFRLLATLGTLLLAIVTAFGAGGWPAAAATPPGTATYQTFITYYGWWDNTPPGGAIAFPAIHRTAGGTGTYADPITFATSRAELAPGTIVYVPRVGKYFMMEDSCDACRSDWIGHGPDGGPGLRHIDLWLGGRGGNPMAAINCEGALTNTTPNGTPLLEPVIVNPPGDLAVDPMPLFNTATGQCYDNALLPATVGEYKNVADGKCIDDPHNSSAPGVVLVTAPCNRSPEQQFTFQGAFLLRHNLCADYATGAISLRTCTAGPTQQWSVNPNGTISDIQTGLNCIATSGTRVIAGGCSGRAAQWTFRSSLGPVGDFSVRVSSTSASVVAGSWTTVSVSTAVTAGAAEPLGLYAAGFPAGGRAVFSPAFVAAGDGSIMAIRASSGTVPGAYLIAITASGANVTHTVFVTLTVARFHRLRHK